MRREARNPSARWNGPALAAATSLLQKLVMEVGQLSFTGSLDPASGLCRRLGSEVLRQLIEAGCPDPQLCHTHEARERGERERERERVCARSSDPTAGPQIQTES